MKRYFIFLAYNGAAYCGWQIQPNGITIQEKLEEALTTLLKLPTAIVGAGRTDSGVHARGMVAHFDCPIEKIDLPELCYRLNRILPYDISIDSIVQVRDDAHARFDAMARTYRYYITTTKDPFLHQLKCKVQNKLDMRAMNQSAKLLLEYNDFTSFSKLHTDVKTNICKITKAEWTEKKEGEYVFTIQADRFLRDMVRAIVGTLIEVGRGKWNMEDMQRIIEAKDRSQAGSSAPGHALFLEEVKYDTEIFDI